MNSAKTSLLWRIAERAMVDRGFLPAPPPEALAEVSRPFAAPETLGDARDLRALPWTSIDNPDSLDLDQIEALEQRDDGTRLLVGIADVDRFVPPSSATNGFAAHNTTSVYTGVRTFPMLPERLSFQLSSLLPDGPRLAVVVETLLGRDGKSEGESIYLALVENHAKLDYPSVSAWLDGHGPIPPPLDRQPTLRAQLEEQDRLSRVLADARRRAGALDVSIPETRPVLDEHGNVTELAVRHQDRAGGIIEELMIVANSSVARFLDRGQMPSLRRVVRQPERWQSIRAYAHARGVELPESPSPQALSGFVDAMRAQRPEEFGEISLSLVKLIGRGEYVAHRPGAPELGHFGLATLEYTHSTAPNRRYPDLVTERLIKALLASAPPPYSFEALAAVAARSTEQEAAADKVTRRVRKSAAAMLLEHRVGQLFDGLVTGASDKGCYVRISAPPVEGKVVSGERGLEVGDKVRLRLRNVNVERGFIDFDVV